MAADKANRPSKKHNVLLLGGTGSIGGAIAQVLRNRGHQVTCLVRSKQSESKLQTVGFKTIFGNIRTPLEWIEETVKHDAVIQAAATWEDDMAQVDQQLMSALVSTLSSSNTEKTLIYTGGCWLYGNTDDEIATEDSPYDALPEFKWSIDIERQVCSCKKIRGMVIHPAMVYERNGGVFEQMVADLHLLGYIRIIGNHKTRWTLVHRNDLAQLYALTLESGKQGTSYNGTGIVSMEVSTIAQALARQHGISRQPEYLSVDEAIRQIGNLAKGYALDQQMSSAKAINELGWNPKHTDVLADLAMIID